MNILLIQPPIQDFYFTPIRSFPLGLASLAAALKKEGHYVEILDCIQGGKKAQRVDEPLFLYLDEYYYADHLSPFGLFHEYKHYGLSFERIRREISVRHIDVCGISVLFSAYAREALHVARMVREEHSHASIVLGGQHATFYSKEILQEIPEVDYVICGEGEETLCELLTHRGSPERVRGIAYRDIDGQVHLTEARPFIKELKNLSWPDRSSFSLDSYTIGNERYAPLQTSRGCPLSCSFCTIPQFMGNTVRRRSITDIVEEITYCYETLRIRIFDIEDDNLTAQKEWVIALLEKIERVYGNTLELTAMNGLSYHFLDEEIITQLVRSGMKRLNISLVSGADEVSSLLNRKLAREHFEKVVWCAHRIGMHITAYYILGFPEDTIENILHTVRFLAGLPVLIGPSVYYHVPGSRLFAELEKRGGVSRRDYPFFRSTAFFYEDDTIKRSDMITLFRITRLINYIKGLVNDCQSGDITLSSLLNTQIPEVIERKRIHGNGDYIFAPQAIEGKTLGIFLLNKFLAEKKFYSFKKKKMQNGFEYHFVAERASTFVIQSFFDETQEWRIRSIRDAGVILS